MLDEVSGDDLERIALSEQEAVALLRQYLAVLENILVYQQDKMSCNCDKPAALRGCFVSWCATNHEPRVQPGPYCAHNRGVRFWAKAWS